MPLPCSPQVNILHVRALIKADTVILFDTYGSADSRLHSVFVYHLEVSAYILQMCSRSDGRHHEAQFASENVRGSLRISVRIPPLTGSPPLRGYPQHSPTQWSSDSALESTLLSVLSALEAEMVFIRNLVGGLLAELEDDIDHDRFKRLLHYSRRLASFQSRAKLVSSGVHRCSACSRLGRCLCRFKKLWRRF